MDAHLTAQEEASLPRPTVNVFTKTGAGPGSVRGRGLWTLDRHRGVRCCCPLPGTGARGGHVATAGPAVGSAPSPSSEAAHGGLRGLLRPRTRLCILMSAAETGARGRVCAPSVAGLKLQIKRSEKGGLGRISPN